MWKNKTEEKKKFVGEKPDHENQVFGYPGDGVRLQLKSSVDKGRLRSFTTVKQDGKWIDVIFEDGQSSHLSLADSGMIAYEHGLWNLTNWVVRL